MNPKLQLLIAGRSKQDLEALQKTLRRLPGIELNLRLLSNNHVDPLHGSTTLPDVLIFNLSANGEAELKALMARPASARPTTLVIGPSSDTPLLRLAMQAGARDFFTRPVSVEEIAAALRQIVREKLATVADARLTAVISAKGGSGTSFLASNLAYIMAAHLGLHVVLVDMDLQFGTQAFNLDLHPTQGLIEALNAVETLDAVALEGYMSKHKSGLHLLTALADHIGLPGEVSTERLGQLLELLRLGYNHLMVDLPRLVDPLTTLVVERADQIVIVLRQDLANLRNAKRLVHIMRDALEIPPERLTVVINRCDEHPPVRVADIDQTLQPHSLILIPNDFKRVSASMNLGVPLYEYAPRTPITRALMKLAEGLSGKQEMEKKGLIGQLLSRFS